jgi:hypothetical protein
MHSIAAANANGIEIDLMSGKRILEEYAVQLTGLRKSLSLGNVGGITG